MALVVWRYDECDQRSMKRTEIGAAFLHVVEDREVLLSYESISASALVVCQKGARDLPPSKWRPLTETNISDVEMFEPDLIGNVAV
jgi:hypothetical protein